MLLYLVPLFLQARLYIVNRFAIRRTVYCLTFVYAVPLVLTADTSHNIGVLQSRGVKLVQRLSPVCGWNTIRPQILVLADLALHDSLRVTVVIQYQPVYIDELVILVALPCRFVLSHPHTCLALVLSQQSFFPHMPAPRCPRTLLFSILFYGQR